MAAPQSLRVAIEACRPSKSSVARLRPFLQSRRCISHTRPAAASDIIQGFPEVPRGHAVDLSDVALPPSENVETRATTLSPPPSPPTTTKPSSKPPSRVNQPPPPVPLQPKPLPPNVLATHRVPMKHTPVYGLPVASLQLRSYSVRNLEFFADFVLRAAFYLKLPASGPVPLPRRRERWTTIRSNFVHKKSQENFERITYKRLITVMDGDKDVVERWLAFVRKWQFYGVGMKANVWEFSGVDVGAEMDAAYKSGGLEEELSRKMGEFGFNESVGEKAGLERLLRRTRGRGVGSPMSTVREGSLTEEARAYKRGEDVEGRE